MLERITQTKFDKLIADGWAATPHGNNHYTLTKQVGVFKCCLNTILYIIPGAVAFVGSCTLATPCCFAASGYSPTDQGFETSPMDCVRKICSVNHVLHDYFQPCKVAPKREIGVVEAEKSPLINERN